MLSNILSRTKRNHKEAPDPGKESDPALVNFKLS